MKVFLTLFVLFFTSNSFGSERAEVVVLNSIHNILNLRYGNFQGMVEKTYRDYLAGTDFKPRFIHKATLEDFLRIKEQKDIKHVFWLGHGSESYLDGVNTSLMTDYRGKNVAAVFRDLDHPFHFFSIVGCDTSEILEREDIVGFKGRQESFSAIKKSLRHFHKRYNIERTCQINYNSRRVRKILCQNTQGDFQEAPSRKAGKNEDHNGRFTIKLTDTANIPKTLQIYLNGTLVDILEVEANKVFTVKYKKKLIQETNNELIVSTGFRRKKALKYDLDTIDVHSNEYKLKRFQIGQIKTFEGNALFNFSI